LVQEKRGDTMVWVPVHFRLVSLHNLKVRLKVEYNQSNRSLYAPENMLAEGDVK
jgi:hypothetical protein